MKLDEYYNSNVTLKIILKNDPALLMMDRYQGMQERRNVLLNKLRSESRIDFSGKNPQMNVDERDLEEKNSLDESLKDIRAKIQKIDEKVSDVFGISCISEYVWLGGYIKTLKLALEYDSERVWKKICKNYKSDYIKLEGSIDKMIEGTERFRRQQDEIDRLELLYEKFDEMGVKELTKGICGKGGIIEEINIELTPDQKQKLKGEPIND